MALIQCTLGPLTTNVGGQDYVFSLDRARRAVSEVFDIVHLRCFLSVQHYLEVQPLPALPVLLGVSELPAIIQFSPDHQAPVGEMVQAAFDASMADQDEPGFSVEHWNTLPEWDRLVRIQRVIDARQKNIDDAISAAAEAAAEAPRVADAAAANAEAQRVADAEAAAGAERQAAADDEARRAAAAAAKIPDDLTQIAGIGASTAAKLAQLDIIQFAQIARWDEAIIRQLNEDLSLGNSITRNDWVGQAKALQAAKDAAAASAAQG